MKVLIIAYRYPPLNQIASLRPKSWADNFHNYGLHSIIATRDWDGTEQGFEPETITSRPFTVEENETHTVLRIPYKARASQVASKLSRIPLAKNVFVGLRHLIGLGKITNNSAEFEPHLVKYLDRNPVDCIIVTVDPFGQIRLGYKLSKKFSVPLIIDFRDLWTNETLNPNSKRILKDKILSFFDRTYISKRLKSTILVTTVSKGLLGELQKMLTKSTRAIVVANGFEQTLLNDLSGDPRRNSRFTFSVIGTLYPQQDFNCMLRGLNLFLSDKDLTEISLNFVGAAMLEPTRIQLSNALPRECTSITERIPRSLALEKMVMSDVLSYIGWKGYKGIVTGKIFEYLAAKRNILIAPNDHDEMERILMETRAGKLADTPEEFAEILNEWFYEWKASGHLKYHGDEEKINFYTREKQAEIFAKEILKVISEKE